MSKLTASPKDSEILEYFLTTKKAQGCTERTVRYYEENIKLFRVFLNDITLVHATQFQIMSYLTSKKVSPATVHIYYRVLKTFYRWMLEQEFRYDNPMLKVPAPKIPHTVIVTLKEEQINDLLKYCGSTSYLKIRNTALILLMLDTAIRRAEVIAMNLNDVDWQNFTVKIHGKGRKERYVHFSPDTAMALKKYLLYHPRQHDNFWLTEERKPFTENALSKVFMRVSNKAGIKDVRCSPHTLRHTSACMYLENEGSIPNLQQLMGHSSLKSTEIYIETVRSKQALKEHTTASPVAHLKKRKL
jgi:integrase/recombinase XerD